MTFLLQNNREYLHLGKLPDHNSYLFIMVNDIPKNNSQNLDQALFGSMRILERQENLIPQSKRLLWVFSGP